MDGSKHCEDSRAIFGKMRGQVKHSQARGQTFGIFGHGSNHVCGEHPKRHIYLSVYLSLAAFPAICPSTHLFIQLSICPWFDVNQRTIPGSTAATRTRAVDVHDAPPQQDALAKTNDGYSTLWQSLTWKPNITSFIGTAAIDGGFSTPLG